MRSSSAPVDLSSGLRFAADVSATPPPPAQEHQELQLEREPETHQHIISAIQQRLVLKVTSGEQDKFKINTETREQK